MTWWMIALLTIGYLILGSVTSGVISAFDDEVEIEYLIFTALVWPIAVAFGALILIVLLIGFLPAKLGSWIFNCVSTIFKRRKK